MSVLLKNIAKAVKTRSCPKKTHADLGYLSGLARMKLEEALIEVARVDNIDLSTL